VIFDRALFRFRFSFFRSGAVELESSSFLSRFQKGIFFKYFFWIALSLLTTSCYSSRLPDVNAEFEKKYKEEVEKMNQGRDMGANSQEVVTVVQSPNPADINAEMREDAYFYVEVDRFSDKPPRIYLPNGESYEQTRALNPSNSIPPDMFEISYGIGLYPPFRQQGVEFERIAIPPRDVYGVKTQMSEKPYLLAGNNSVQKSVDRILSEKTPEDVENSEILINERKAFRRKQRMIKTFGESDFDLGALAKKDQKPKEEKEITAEENL
jgi:hypothetical protein